MNPSRTRSTNKTKGLGFFKWKLTRPLLSDIWGRWNELNIRCSYGCLPENLLNRLRKKRELSSLLIIFAVQLFESALTSVMITTSSSSARTWWRSKCQIYILLFIFVNVFLLPFPCCRNTSYTQYHYIYTAKIETDWSTPIRDSEMLLMPWTERHSSRHPQPIIDSSCAWKPQ